MSSYLLGTPLIWKFSTKNKVVIGNKWILTKIQGIDTGHSFITYGEVTCTTGNTQQQQSACGTDFCSRDGNSSPLLLAALLVQWQKSVPEGAGEMAKLFVQGWILLIIYRFSETPVPTKLCLNSAMLCISTSEITPHIGKPLHVQNISWQKKEIFNKKEGNRRTCFCAFFKLNHNRLQNLRTLLNLNFCNIVILFHK